MKKPGHKANHQPKKPGHKANQQPKKPGHKAIHADNKLGGLLSLSVMSSDVPLHANEINSLKPVGFRN